MKKHNKGRITHFQTISGMADMSAKDFSKSLQTLTYLDDTTKMVITEMHKSYVLSIAAALTRLMKTKGITITGENITTADIHALCDTVEKMEDIKPIIPNSIESGDSSKSRFN